MGRPEVHAGLREQPGLLFGCRDARLLFAQKINSGRETLGAGEDGEGRGWLRALPLENLHSNWHPNWRDDKQINKYKICL